jgi:hypothetical protein
MSNGVVIHLPIMIAGKTPQLGGLQELYDKYKSQGLEVLSFPSNDFFQDRSVELFTISISVGNNIELAVPYLGYVLYVEALRRTTKNQAAHCIRLRSQFLRGCLSTAQPPILCLHS